MLLHCWQVCAPCFRLMVSLLTNLACIGLWVVVKMFVPETDVNVAVVACNFMWQPDTW